MIRVNHKTKTITLIGKRISYNTKTIRTLENYGYSIVLVVK